MGRHSSKGNVLFIILIAIGLFAALAYTVSNSFRGGTDTISKEQARIAAGGLVRAMNDAKQGMDFLYTQRGCSLYNQTSPITLNNPAKPVWLPSPERQYECFVYHPTGGGVAFPQHLSQLQLSSFLQDDLFRGQLLAMRIQTYDNIQQNTPSDQLPTAIVLLAPTDTICVAFNRMFNIAVNNDIPPTINDSRFAGKKGGCYLYMPAQNINMAYMIYQ